MKRPKIAAVVLTKNEEVNLKRCLFHLGWANDLVVVDSGSNDKTLEIAKRAGARVFVHLADGFYIAEQRNWALENTDIKTEWVLFIDADEVVTKKLEKEIIRAINVASPEVVGFQLCFKFIFLGQWLKHSSGFPCWHDRLLKKGKAKFKGKVWESFETPGKVERIREPYLHYGFDKGITAWLERHQRYADWKAQEFLELESRGKTSFWRLIKKFWQGKDQKHVLEKMVIKTGLLSPFLKFCYHYFIKMGFLDGKAGLIYSLMMGYYQFMIYLCLLEKKRKKGLSCIF